MLEKVEKFFAKVMGGTSTERELKAIRPIVGEINEFAESYKNLTDDELKAKTHEFRYRLRMGETLDDILPEAFAAVKDTCRRLRGKKWKVRGTEAEWDMVPYDVQLIGGVVLHKGEIAEMATGEGKTLVATMPLYLNALEGKGAHLITVNDYLAQRDCEWMGEIYRFLGLTVESIHNNMEPEERRRAYNADITYGTNNEFGFDYLRDNMSTDVWSVVQRGLHYAIVDEVDSVLIDEARTPLIISGAVGAPRNIYNELRPIVSNLYHKQKELVDELVTEGKALLEKDEDRAGMMLLRAQRGNPKNQVLLDLMTSEFWVKKLIERIQGQYEINKIMHEVDSELYYTIDEKSHVVDITEKGRIFLSGGRDQDVASKIQKLDEMDEILSRMGNKKKASVFFTHDPMTGFCNGLSLDGKIALCNVNTEISNEEIEALDILTERFEKISEKVNEAIQNKRTDKGSAWRRYFLVAKRMDRVVNGLNEEGKEYFEKGGDTPEYRSLVEALEKLFTAIRDEADVDGGFSGSRQQQERRRNLQNIFFNVEKQFGCPTGLREEGRLALLTTLHDGDPLIVPFISKLDSMLKSGNGAETQSSAQADRKQEYFEFSDNGAILKHITEKGRIALLGGNPDLYILPDRSLVEDRDQQIQKLLDETLNQSTFDYAAKVIAIEHLEKDIVAIHQYLSSFPENERQKKVADFYKVVPPKDESGQLSPTIKLTESGRAFFADFAEQTQALVFKLDKDLRNHKNDLSAVFRVDEKNRISGLSSNELDDLLGRSFAEVKSKIEEWRHGRIVGDSDSSVALRLSLDAFLASHFQTNEMADTSSLSRRFEDVDRIDGVMQSIFRVMGRGELTGSEVQRILRRYFESDSAVETDKLTLNDLKINGLSESGMLILVGTVAEREKVTEKIEHFLDDPEMESDALFELTEEGFPARLRKSARSQLLDGLPFFPYAEELQKFRDELLQMSSKKVNTRSELDGLLSKEKAHLRGKHIMLDDREMNEMLSKAHAQNVVLTAEEIEHWFRTSFARKPRKILEETRDRQWREYSEVEDRVQNISQLLKAYTLYQKDVDYVVKTPEESEMRGRAASARGRKAVMIVDQFTGRLMPGRRFSDGLHEALEAKEGVEVQAESQTLATITLQNFFRLYDKLAGMTGTAETEAQEFFSTYKMDVIVIPTNRPVIRDDYNDVIYRTKKEKYDALIDEAISMHEHGRPVLIGTISVDVSQKLSEMFTRRGVPIANWLKKGDVSRELESGRFHTVLNAKYHNAEAEIVAKAGLPGAITIATNMAGRGTDIKLTPEVVKAGGLHIIGSEKHEARRIDRQLRGRSGRQGDPGSSRFYLSLEDDLMRLFGSDRITSIMSRMGSMDEGERIEHPLITRSIERAQKKVEERNFDIRKNLLEYDDVLNEQRKIIYKRRQNLLGFADADDLVESKSKLFFGEEDERGDWKLDELLENLKHFFGAEPDFTVEDLEQLKYSEIREKVAEWVQERIGEERHLSQMQERHRIFGYCDVDSLIDNLVHLKIQLHDAGTRDTSKWNYDGIALELKRIFGDSPEWLHTAEGAQAPDLEKRITDWAKDHYQEIYQQCRDGFNAISFSKLSLAEMAEIYVFGLLNIHLSLNVPSISWETDEFLNDLERVFFARPDIGSKEIRTIRRAKLIGILNEWLRGLPLGEQDDEKIRHRILGYFGAANFLQSIVSYSFRGMDEENGKNITQLDPGQKTFLDRVFGSVFDEIPADKDDDLSLTQRVSRIAREEYYAILKENMPKYDSMMFADATIEELIEASILAVSQEILHKPVETSEKQKLLSQYFEYMFLSKPTHSFPADGDEQKLASFREDLVAWGLNLYKIYSERAERLRQEKLSGEIIRDSIYMWIDDTIYTIISNVLGEGADLDANQVRRIEAECRLVFRQGPRFADDSDAATNPSVMMDEFSSWAKNLYRRRVEEIGDETVTRYERYYTLDKIDENWRQHLAAIDDLREGIGLRGYGQKDPLLEYKGEAYKMFVKMIEDINRNVVSTLFKVFDIGGEIEEQQNRRIEPKSFVTSHSQVEVYKQVMAPQAAQKASHSQSGTNQGGRRAPVVKKTRVGRNDPCPCGSGKKYKNCCGRNL